jgi:predicted ATP-dependent serine protease
MDPTHAATALVASPAWDLAVATSVVAVAPEVAVASEVAVAPEVAVASEVAAVVAGECCESKFEITGARI